LADQHRKDGTKMANIIEVRPVLPLGDFDLLILPQRNFEWSISDPVEIDLMNPGPNRRPEAADDEQRDPIGSGMAAVQRKQPRLRAAGEQCHR